MSRIADWPIASVTADDLERFKETRLREHQQAAVVALLRRRQKAHDDDNPAALATAIRWPTMSGYCLSALTLALDDPSKRGTGASLEPSENRS